MSDFKTYLTCRKCHAEIPLGKSMAEYAKIAVGINKDGEYEVWCNRHHISVAILTDELKTKLIGAPCEECGKHHNETHH